MSLIPIPGNTQDQYEELADHIAQLIKWQIVTNDTVSTTNAWTDMPALSSNIENDELYYICLLVGDKMTSNNFILSGVDLKALTSAAPAYLVSSIDESNTKQIFICYTASNKIAYYCGASVFPNKTKKIYVMRMLKKTT